MDRNSVNSRIEGTQNEDEKREHVFRLGFDLGSTTVKAVLVDDDNRIVFSEYRRHHSNIADTLKSVIKEVVLKFGDIPVIPVITGSGGMGIAEALKIPFVQEVIAENTALKAFIPDADVAIELGGEDAKIIYLTNGVEQRMNGVCAGGTGAFIDQMALLLGEDVEGLNKHARNFKNIYPIAARCGVFAKSDIQSLINSGATKEDIAASVFQAIVIQTISGLACGKPIRGKIVFLGGPLFFLDELRNAFIRTLHLTEGNAVLPDDAHLFAALGAAMWDSSAEMCRIAALIEKTNDYASLFIVRQNRLERLFADRTEYEKFTERHAKNHVKRTDLSTYQGDCFIGFDAGSTTTKAALVAEDGSLLYSFYSINEGAPVRTAERCIRELAGLLPKGAKIRWSCSTGYGEELLKAAYRLDEGEVETIAHYYAAAFFKPSVDCIVDIGGQDMKCIRIKDGAVDSIMLNEACSSGCGSFIESFAQSLNYSVKEFAELALFAEAPVDLGQRCTVFMNAGVKQAQKEGAGVADISTGLAFSVIRNALYKVLRMHSSEELGKSIVVQGGTFRNDAVLRAFEKLAGCEVTRPDISEIMGAFGAALIARERYFEKKRTEAVTTSMLSFDEILSMKYTVSGTHCNGCENHCLLTVSRFDGDRTYISGNRCEKGGGIRKDTEDLPNLYSYKRDLLFQREVLAEEKAVRGTVGIPRVLNIYENYPFWADFFRELGYRVVLSPVSSKKIYELGLESIPSDTTCYPAKLAHGHVEWLIDQGIRFIFYPCIAYETKETEGANNHFNCPVVTSYPENIRNNVEEIEKRKVDFFDPFLSFESEKTITAGLTSAFSERYGIDKKEIKKACHKAWESLIRYRAAVRKKGEETLKWLEENHRKGIVLCGTPYHVDPEINHGIAEMITGYGYAVLSEDSVAHLCEVERPLITNDQWVYHSRMYNAAAYVRKCRNLEMVRLISFGCGVSAISEDQVADILVGSGRFNTQIKIDEMNSLGPAKIRLRSLFASARMKEKSGEELPIRPTSYQHTIFTKEMKDYTILAPMMSEIHFGLMEAAARSCGYNIEVLRNETREVVEDGQKFVNNDACYPSTIAVGQIMNAVLSGKYDTNHLAVLMGQTGGGCRLSNYIGFIRRALDQAGMGHIPVISLNVNGMETSPGFRFTIPMMLALSKGVILGDVLMKVLYATRPYEKEKGAANALYQKWEAVCKEYLSKRSLLFHKKEMNEVIRGMVHDFDTLERTGEKKKRVGITGELMMQYSRVANNNLVDVLEKEGSEAVIPTLFEVPQSWLVDAIYAHDHYGKSAWSKKMAQTAIHILDNIRMSTVKILDGSRHFTAGASMSHMMELAGKIVSIGNQTGEGWMLAGEMAAMIEEGVTNFICVQPFGCLPNHIIGKGIIKKFRTMYPEANIVKIDYDPGASEVNQLNRIRLMLDSAK